MFVLVQKPRVSGVFCFSLVSDGGHDVVYADLQRRFPRSLHNFLYVFAERVDEAVCLWSGDNGVQLVFRQEGAARKVADPILLAHLLKEASDARE